MDGKQLETWAYGAGKPGLSLEQVRNLVVPLPPLAEQTRIVAEVERRLSVVEELEATVAANLRRAARLRQSILQRAFAGKIGARRRVKATLLSPKASPVLPKASLLSGKASPVPEVRHRPPRPRHCPAAAPAGLQLRHGELSGSITARYHPARPKSMNEVQTNPGDPNDAAGWVYAGRFSGGKATLAGLTPASTLWVRVRTARIKGVTDAWSDPAKIIVT